MLISMIVAYGNNWQIGLNNKLLWYIKEDLKKFKDLTQGHHIIMGRKTFLSINKVLNKRTNIVLSKTNFYHEDIHTCNSIKEALDFCKKNKEREVFIIGGAEIYELSFPYINKLYLTQVNYDGIADTYLQKINFKSWLCEKKEFHKEVMQNEKVKTLAWTYSIYNKLHSTH